MNVILRSIRNVLSRSVSTSPGKLGLVAIVLSTLALLAFINPIRDSGTASSPDNPDGVDPPEENPLARGIVHLQVIAPASIHVSLYEDYYAPSGRGFGSAMGPGLCTKNYDPNKPGLSAGHSRQIPIVLTGNNGVLSGTFTTDRFSPGRCEWGFFGISSNFKEDTPVLYSPGGPVPAYPHGPEQVADIWCGDNPISSEQSKYICASFQFFAQYTKGLPESLLAAHPYVVSRGAENIVSMDDTTRTVVLRYHDLKSEAIAAGLAKDKPMR
jgi:hypothetical protein